jgi:hypothetical protein
VRHSDAAVRPQILARLTAGGDPIPLILDQNKASDRHQVLLLSVRWGERALPVAWRVEETDGALASPPRKTCSTQSSNGCPGTCAWSYRPDRFYGTHELIRWCRDQGWDYCLRLKGNLTTHTGWRKATTGELANSGARYFDNVALISKRVSTNIGIIRDLGHTEPWIIAMSIKPGYLSTLEYSPRWASSRCSLTSSRAALASRRRRSSVPTASGVSSP